MSTVRNVAKNTGFLLTGDLVFRLMSLIITVYIARYLGTADFGKYSFVFAYLAFFGILADLGFRQILVREMSRNKSLIPKLVGNAYIIALILGIFSVSLSVIIIKLMSYPADTTTYVYIASFTVFFSSFSEFYFTIFYVNFRMDYSIIAKLIFKILSLILILWIIFSKGTLTQILIVLVFSEMVKTLISYSFSKKFVRPEYKIDIDICKYLFNEALPLSFFTVIWIIHFRINVLMLSLMQGDAPVGIYSAAYTLSEPLLLIPNALVVSLFPIMSASFKISNERLIKIFGLSIKYILIAILPIAIGTTLIADKIIFLIYGLEFAGSATALQILIWALVFTSVNSVLLNLLVSIDKQKLNAISITLSAIINVALNFILIPLLSYKGAAISTVATNILFFGVNYYFISNHLKVPNIFKISIKPLTSGLIMGIFIYYFININSFLVIFGAGAIYLITLFSLKTFTNEDWDIVKKLTRISKPLA